MNTDDHLERISRDVHYIMLILSVSFFCALGAGVFWVAYLLLSN
jgi:threonine/homoserine efflux transporter RhtA